MVRGSNSQGIQHMSITLPLPSPDSVRSSIEPSRPATNKLTNQPFRYPGNTPPSERLLSPRQAERPPQTSVLAPNHQEHSDGTSEAKHIFHVCRQRRELGVTRKMPRTWGALARGERTSTRPLSASFSSIDVAFAAILRTGLQC